jgi:hypothetical protein
MKPIDFAHIGERLLEDGFAVIPRLCSASTTGELASMWKQPDLFRKHVVMRRHAFGEGEYAYFDDPLPNTVGRLRQRLYAELAPTANTMMERLGRSLRYPPTLAAYLRRCAKAGQSKPTPLLLRYEQGGYNRLHRDLYGELAFPLQVTTMLSRPGTDFDGGRFLLVANTPRQQARGEAIDLARGDAIIFPTADFPVVGARGWRRAEMRHGVSTVARGVRITAGFIFHNAA